jgi:guanylate kinase
MPRRSPDRATSKVIRPLLIILSGPSGAGKDAVLSRMKETRYPLHYVVTLTTRPRRPQERDNVDYHFIAQEEFLRLQQNDELLESATVYGNWYGVPKKDVLEAMNAGKDVLVKVDVQGAETIKKIVPQAVAIFLSPPSMEDLLARLRLRSTESSLEVDVRIKAAEDEFSRLPSFDYLVVNRWGEIDKSVSDITDIIMTEKSRVMTGKL